MALCVILNATHVSAKRIDTAFVFPLTYEIADELERVGGEVLGGVNRSKAFRVMVAYFASIYKLKSPTYTTGA